MPDLPMPQAGQMARSKYTGRTGSVLIELDPAYTCPIAVGLPGTVPQWMTLEDFHRAWEIVETCCECGGTGWKAVAE